MASRRADCTFAGARLISSASTKLAKIGPFFTWKVSLLTLYIIVPITSPGRRSGVNCIRLYFASMSCASVLMAKVFARPGTPSSSTWPLARRATRRLSTKCFCPTMVWSIPRVTRVVKSLLLATNSLSSRMLTLSLIVMFILLAIFICLYLLQSGMPRA